MIGISIRIVSKRSGGHAALPGESVIDVDRAHPVLGNPFVLRDHHDGVERERVINQYGEKLRADLAVKGPMSQALDALAERAVLGERIALRCWCAPKPCHADLLRNEILTKLGLAEDIEIRISAKKQIRLF